MDTYEQLEEFLIDEAGWRARLNRRVSSRVVRLGVLSWADQPYEPGMRRRVWDEYKRLYGLDPLTLLILGAIVNVVIQALLKWWYGDQINRGRCLWRMKRELEGNGGWKSGDH